MEERDVCVREIMQMFGQYLVGSVAPVVLLRLLGRFRSFLYEFSDEERLCLIHWLFKVVFCHPDLDMTLRHSFSLELLNLIQVKKLPGLVLPWQYVLSSTSQHVTYKELGQCIKLSRGFCIFPNERVSASLTMRRGSI